MSSAATSSDIPDVKFRGFVTLSIMLATIMQVLDTTIANVALPHMQGSLSSTQEQVTWILTSYIVASAIMTLPTAWLAGRYGRKNVFLDRKSTRLNSSHVKISYAVFCLKKKKN